MGAAKDAIQLGLEVGRWANRYVNLDIEYQRVKEGIREKQTSALRDEVIRAQTGSAPILSSGDGATGQRLASTLEAFQQQLMALRNETAERYNSLEQRLAAYTDDLARVAKKVGDMSPEDIPTTAEQEAERIADDDDDEEEDDIEYDYVDEYQEDDDDEEDEEDDGDSSEEG